MYRSLFMYIRLFVRVQVPIHFCRSFGLYSCPSPFIYVCLSFSIYIRLFCGAFFLVCRDHGIFCTASSMQEWFICKRRFQCKKFLLNCIHISCYVYTRRFSCMYRKFITQKFAILDLELFWSLCLYEFWSLCLYEDIFQFICSSLVSLFAVTQRLTCDTNVSHVTQRLGRDTKTYT